MTKPHFILFLVAIALFFVFTEPARADITSGLTGHWKFDENSGTIAADSAGTNPGTLVNGPVWTAGKLSSALKFNATDDGIYSNDPRVVIGRNFDIPSLPFTISAWVNPVDFNDYRSIFSKRDSNSASDMRVDVGLIGGGTGKIYIYTVSSNEGFDYVPALNTWTHIVLTFESTGTKLYINGGPFLAPTNVLTLGTDASANVVIGSNGESLGGDPFKGMIDDVRVYNRALSSSDVAELYNFTSAVPLGISSVLASSIMTSGAIISWTTSQNSNSQIDYGLTTAYGNQTSLDSSLVTSHSQNLSGLSYSTVYNYRVKSRDAAGNLIVSPNFTFTTAAASALLPSPAIYPTIEITVPAAGSTISGPVNISADVSAGVVGVQFKLDGENLGKEVTVSPYSSLWDTTLSTNGSHNLTAVARNSANNQTLSSIINVTVNNTANIIRSVTARIAPTLPSVYKSDTVPPSAPSGLTAIVASPSEINLSWTTPTDNVEVTRYLIERCQGVGCSDFKLIAVPSRTAYKNRELPSGTYVYRVRATDAAGNLSEYSTSTATTLPTTSTKFIIGNKIQVTANINVRSCAGIACTLLGVQSTGEQGTIVGGPTFADGFWWWNIDYNNAFDGWSTENFLKL